MSTYSKTSARDQVLDAVRKLVDRYKDEETSITLIQTRSFLSRPLHLLAPELEMRISKSYALLVLRITNEEDLVPRLPLDLWPDFDYKHVGEELRIDTRNSPYVKSSCDEFHNLELYIHGVAGTQGDKGGFNLEVDRDIALVNQDIDGLKDEYNIPAGWWGIEDNKGLVLEEMVADGDRRLLGRFRGSGGRRFGSG
ncbi:unnamed protein product [Dovyalis caffra]|uniref:Phospholipase A1 n=1 Tax=Dovyalis caffra TaxID=77055 RepID=A0AAV1SGU5_9ROSI|nr:unnamed protein product [Dovyalis caffra]